MLLPVNIHSGPVDPRSHVLSMRIICAMLAMGTATFAVVASVIPLGNQGAGGAGAGAAAGSGGSGAGNGNLEQMLLIALAAMAVVFGGGWLVIGRRAFAALARRAWASRSDETAGMRAVLTVLATRTIVAAAIAEGIGMFGGVTMLLTKNPIALAAPAGALAVIAMVFPTNGRVSAFVNAATRNDATA